MYLLLTWACVLVASISMYLHQRYSRFSKYGIKGPKPVPFFGTLAGITFKKEHFTENLEKIYNAFPNERFVGIYQFLEPIAFIRDLELIKKITSKDFDHFTDHRPMFDSDTDQFFGNNLFSMKGQVWKDMRSTLSLAFTSSKIRAMVPLMVEVGNQMIEDLMKKIQISESGVIEVVAKDFSTKYANDVIATCAFGLKVDTHTDENNKFYKMATSITTFDFKNVLKLLAQLALPKFLTRYLPVSIFSKEAENFYSDLVLGTMKNREKNHIFRPDMIHLLMEAKKGTLSHDASETKDSGAGFATVEESSIGKRRQTRVWTDMDLIPQAIIFLFAGFETVSTLMSFLLIELALNPDVQDKLVKEIRENEEQTGGIFDYSSIQQMTYMDMVVSETLRLWPPIGGLDRLCVKDYCLGKQNEGGQDFWLRKGETVTIPSWIIHKNPEYFPNPTKFDPERFAPENQKNIKPFTYMPFGLGPRNCIGSRFALCEVKVMIYQLLQHMEISPSKKLQVPLVLSKGQFNMRIDGGEWVQMKIRK